MGNTTAGSPASTAPAEPVRLRAPRNLVDRRAILWWTLRPTVFWLVVVAAAVALHLMSALPAVALPWVIGAAVVLGAAHATVMPQWRYRVHRWESTSDAVFTRTGWLNKEWRVAPVSRIQTIDTKRGPLEQLLGLATVTITTASAAGPVEIAGIEHTAADRIVAELTATTQAVPGDAT
jgi:membrane protein YdbS with pleckstrin-like domain